MLLSIIVTVRNEISHISKSFESILLSASLVESEIFFVDGQSNDGTYEWLKKAIKKHKHCKLRLNKRKFVSFAFNSVFHETKGKYISRVDGHTIYPKTYFFNALDILKNKGVDVVGGPANHIGYSWQGISIANCMMNPFGVGNSKFRTSKKETYVDTVPFPIYKKSVLETVGLYDEELVKNQDDELNYRCRANGYKILMSPRLITDYIVRENLAELWKQYFLYGFYKPAVFKKVNYGSRFYHYIPAIHSLSTIISIVVWYFNSYGLLYLFCYLFFGLIFSIRVSKTFKSTLYSMLVFPSIHYSYGFGFIKGYFVRMHQSYKYFFKKSPNKVNEF